MVFEGQALYRMESEEEQDRSNSSCVVASVDIPARNLFFVPDVVWLVKEMCLDEKEGEGLSLKTRLVLPISEAGSCSRRVCLCVCVESHVLLCGQDQEGLILPWG